MNDLERNELLKSIGANIFYIQSYVEEMTGSPEAGQRKVVNAYVNPAGIPNAVCVVVQYKYYEEIYDFYGHIHKGSPDIFDKIYTITDNGEIFDAYGKPIRNLTDPDVDTEERLSELQEMLEKYSKEKNKVFKTYYTLRRHFNGEEDIYPEKFPAYIAAFDKMCHLYQISLELPFGEPAVYGIYRTTETEYRGQTNSMTQPVWGS